MHKTTILQAKNYSILSTRGDGNQPFFYKTPEQKAEEVRPKTIWL